MRQAAGQGGRSVAAAGDDDDDDEKFVCLSALQAARGICMQTMLGHHSSVARQKIENLFEELKSSMGLRGDVEEFLENLNNDLKPFGIQIEAVQGDSGPRCLALQFVAEQTTAKIRDFEMMKGHSQLLIAIIAEIVQKGRELTSAEISIFLQKRKSDDSYFSHDRDRDCCPLDYFVQRHWLEFCDDQNLLADVPLGADERYGAQSHSDLQSRGVTLGARTYLEILPEMPGVKCCDLCQSEVVIRPVTCPTQNCDTRFHYRCIELAMSTRNLRQGSASDDLPTCPFCQNVWVGGLLATSSLREPLSQEEQQLGRHNMTE